METLGYNGNAVIYNVKKHQFINERLKTSWLHREERNCVVSLRNGFTIAKYVISRLFGWQQCVKTVPRGLHFHK